MNVIEVQGQTLEYLDANNVKAGKIGTGGNLFSANPIGDHGLFLTKFDSGRAEIFTASLWMSGIDENGIEHGAAQAYANAGFFDGPIASAYSSSYYNYYRRVFKVSKLQIENFRTLNFPVNSSSIDSAIRYWPAKGNPEVFNDYAVEIDSPLAPFVDLNHNGIYEPLLGDYPAVAGDQAIFFVVNDVNGLHGAVNCSPLGIEVRGLVTCYNDTTAGNTPYNKRAVNNSIFVEYQVENKSQHTYSAFDIAQWLDPDIGCFDNDYVGCDSASSLMFAYNGTADDPDCAPELGYGTLPVALGVQLLSQPMSVFSIVGLSFSDSAQIDTLNNCNLLKGLLEGMWADSSSSPLEYGGTGYDSIGYKTKYIFHGDPTDASQWSEVSNHSVPGDRRMYGATDSLTMVPGQTINFSVAFFTSFDSTSNYISIVDTLKRDADSIKSFYLQQIVPAEQVLSINEVKNGRETSIFIYPNPTNNQVTINSSDYMKSIEIMDIQGRLLLTETVGAKTITLPVSNLAKGVYLVSIQCAGGSVVKRIVVE